MRRFLKGLSLVTMTAMLVACGGGGGGSSSDSTPPVVQGPPTTAGVLADSAGDAAQSTKSVVAAADAAADTSKSMTGVFALFGAPTGLRPAPDAGHAHALAVQVAPCTDVLASPCSGSATLDTNLASTATSAPAGSYIDVSFANMSGPLEGNTITLTGRMRIDFLAAFDLTNPQPTGLDLQLLFDQLSGSVNGSAFGPVSQSLRLQVDSQGRSSVIAGGRRYSSIGSVSVSDAANYSIAGSTVRASHWNNADTYVDLNLTQWHVAGGRPATGSSAGLAAGNGSVTVQVVSSSADSVVYAVALTLNGNTTRYTVTATYPAGGGVPSYVGTPAG